MQHDFAKLARDLEAYMRKHGKTQVQIAENAGVNQATVSRFLKKPPRRNTATAQRLCRYAEILLSQTAESTGSRAVAHNALNECWETSDAHAEAVSKILNALAELCRRNRHEGVTPG